LRDFVGFEWDGRRESGGTVGIGPEFPGFSGDGVTVDSRAGDVSTLPPTVADASATM